MQDAKKIFLKTNPDIVCREEDGEALLFNPENGLIKMLNRVGYEVWKLCDGSLTLEQIIEKVKGKYPDTPAEIIKKDIIDFINYMKNLALIEKINKQTTRSSS